MDLNHRLHIISMTLSHWATGIYGSFDGDRTRDLQCDRLASTPLLHEAICALRRCGCGIRLAAICLLNPRSVSLLCFFIFRQAISTKPHISVITTNDYRAKLVVVELTNPCYRLMVTPPGFEPGLAAWKAALLTCLEDGTIWWRLWDSNSTS